MDPRLGGGRGLARSRGGGRTLDVARPGAGRGSRAPWGRGGAGAPGRRSGPPRPGSRRRRGSAPRAPSPAPPESRPVSSGASVGTFMLVLPRSGSERGRSFELYPKTDSPSALLVTQTQNLAASGYRAVPSARALPNPTGTSHRLDLKWFIIDKHKTDDVLGKIHSRRELKNKRRDRSRLAGTGAQGPGRGGRPNPTGILTSALLPDAAAGPGRPDPRLAPAARPPDRLPSAAGRRTPLPAGDGAVR